MPIVLLRLLRSTSPDALTRFPPAAMVHDAREFNRACHCCMTGQQGMHRHRWNDYQQIIDYLNASYRAWDALDDAQDSYPLAGYDAAVQRLRTVLGDDAFFAGRMPPSVPYWLFEEIHP